MPVRYLRVAIVLVGLATGLWYCTAFLPDSATRGVILAAVGLIVAGLATALLPVKPDPCPTCEAREQLQRNAKRRETTRQLVERLEAERAEALEREQAAQAALVAASAEVSGPWTEAVPVVTVEAPAEHTAPIPLLDRGAYRDDLLTHHEPGPATRIAPAPLFDAEHVDGLVGREHR